MLLKALHWMGGVAVAILSRLPIIQCLTPYGKEVHGTALKKFAALLVLTSLPVIVSVALAPMPGDASSAFDKLISKFADTLTVTELFVYSATFLTPILYLQYERFSISNFSNLDALRKAFRGYGLVTLLALILIVLTAVAFAAVKFHHDLFKATFLNYYLGDYAIAVYLFGLYCWYLTLLDGANSSGFVQDNRDQELGLTNKLASRLRSRVESDD